MDAEFQQIEKELIPILHFPNEEILEEQADIKQRSADLSRAQALGNLEHVKIKIYFIDSEGRKMVETTVWGITEERVILKQGVIIPVNRICKII